MKFWRSLNIAFMFLSRLPMPRLNQYQELDQRRSGLLFPLVGLILGAVLGFCAFLLQGSLPNSVAAAILLSCWVFITGGLHIDGLADSADAWLGGLGDKARSLEIMKDPRCGSGALFCVICLLLIKYSAIEHLIQQGNVLLFSLPLILMLGRCSAVAIFRFSPYVSQSGSALGFLDLNNSSLINGVLFGYGLLFLLLWPASLWSVFSLLILWLALRQLMISRLGGCTGDTAGASVEIVETAALVALCV